ncbi:MAG: hypothetical protein LBB28_01050 [Synergistaceae bacterium]|jgi:hypothetical protein|nr:hypothetical protein [Synergistaceae bacterium]
MKYIARVISVVLFVVMASGGISAPARAAAKYDAALARWSKTENTKDNLGGSFTLKATLYTAEYIEALMQSEAEKNLWTTSELEDYKYNFLKGINMDENIAIHLEMEELGPTAHMAPFNEMAVLWIGKTKYEPTDHDPRFNMPLQGKRDGMIYFPRYNEKTGVPLLNRSTTLRLVVKGAISPVLNNKELRFIWNVQAEDAAGSISGTAADRLEVDRLIRRMEKLNTEKAELESQLEAKNKELEEVGARIEELQNKYSGGIRRGISV